MIIFNSSRDEYFENQVIRYTNFVRDYSMGANDGQVVNMILDKSAHNGSLPIGYGMKLLDIPRAPIDTMTIYYSDLTPNRRPCADGWKLVKLQKQFLCTKFASKNVLRRSLQICGLSLSVPLEVRTSDDIQAAKQLLLDHNVPSTWIYAVDINNETRSLSDNSRLFYDVKCSVYVVTEHGNISCSSGNEKVATICAHPAEIETCQNGLQHSLAAGAKVDECVPCYLGHYCTGRRIECNTTLESVGFGPPLGGVFECPVGCNDDIWGITNYTTSSSICTAARHSDVIAYIRPLVVSADAGYLSTFTGSYSPPFAGFTSLDHGPASGFKFIGTRCLHILAHITPDGGDILPSSVHHLQLFYLGSLENIPLDQIGPNWNITICDVRPLMVAVFPASLPPSVGFETWYDDAQIFPVGCNCWLDDCKRTQSIRTWGSEPNNIWTQCPYTPSETFTLVTATSPLYSEPTWITKERAQVLTIYTTWEIMLEVKPCPSDTLTDVETVFPLVSISDMNSETILLVYLKATENVEKVTIMIKDEPDLKSVMALHTFDDDKYSQIRVIMYQNHLYHYLALEIDGIQLKNKKILKPRILPYAKIKWELDNATFCSSATEMKNVAVRTHQPFATPIECPIGTYSNASGQSECSQCPEGKTCPELGTIDPEACADGTIINYGVCIPCPSGHYCANEIQTICPAGTYCPASQSTFNFCPVNYFGIEEMARDVSSCIPLPMYSNCTTGLLPNVTNCNCDIGFEGNVTTECLNIDECVTNTTACGLNTKCTDSVGSFTCSCLTGFYDQGHDCGNIDECTDTTICVNSQCNDTFGSYSCICDSGYNHTSADYTAPCENVNECNATPCDENARCDDSIGSFSCTCNTGYSGTGINCSNINECLDTSVCPNAACFDTDGSYTCNCDVGYYKTSVSNNCENINECTNVTICENAECSDNDGSYVCDCIDGYTHTSTQLDTDPCLNVDECIGNTHACDTNANCSDTVGWYACTCNTGWNGDGLTCADMDECMDPTICTNSTCNNSPGSYTCMCTTGYDRETLLPDTDPCSNINECDSAPCDENAACQDTMGSFTCTCNTGWAENKLGCSDINECSNATICTNSYCENTAGSYICICDLGFERDLSALPDTAPCSNVNECYIPDKCDPNADCKDTIGSFSCTCNTGFNGTGTICNNIDECVDSTICEHSSCNDTIGSYHCICDVGYFHDIGVNNTSPCGNVNECNNATSCDQNADCKDTIGSFDCTCHIGFAGDGIFCENINECKNCGKCPHGECVDTIGSYNCICNSGFAKNESGICENVNECITGQHSHTITGSASLAAICTDEECHAEPACSVNDAVSFWLIFFR